MTAPEAGALIARYIGAEGCELSPAALETLAIVAYRQPVTRGADRAHPRRRLGLRGAHAAPSPPDRRAGPRRHARPAHPVRHRLRVPGALRADLARRPAAARGRGGGRGWPSMADAVRIQKALADAGVASRRKRPSARRAGPRDGQRRSRPASASASTRRRPARGRWPARSRTRRRAALPRAGQASRRDQHGQRSPRASDRHRPRAQRASRDASGSFPVGRLDGTRKG